MTILVEKIRSLTDFRRHTKEYVAGLQANKLPMVLTVNGEAVIVVQDASAFQALQAKLADLEAQLQPMQRSQSRSITTNEAKAVYKSSTLV